VDKVEDDIKDSGEDEREEEGSSGQVHWMSAFLSTSRGCQLTVSLGVKPPGGAACQL